MANHQMINPSQCWLSRSPQCKTWKLGLHLLRARTPEHQEYLFSYLVIHPIIGILMLGVSSVWGGVYREIPINGLMTLHQYGYYMVLFYPPFDHGTYSFSSHHFMAVETCFESNTSSTFDTASSLIQRHLLRVAANHPPASQFCAQKQLACCGWNLHKVPPPQRLQQHIAETAKRIQYMYKKTETASKIYIMLPTIPKLPSPCLEHLL